MLNMRKILLLFVCLASGMATQAQFIYDAVGKPLNIYDIMKAHVNAPPSKYREESEHKNLAKERDIKEGGDYQYGRWLWYWQQHTDVNGNLIASSKIWDEWKSYNNNILRNARTTGNSSNWAFQGPDTPAGDNSSGLGRISAMSFHPTNPNTYWIGSDGGGAWKTTDNGATWTCMTDNLPSLVVSDVDINPLNPNTVYICTGDRDHGGWDNHLDLAVGYGMGVFKSYDGGATWDTTGMKWNATALEIANCLVINPTDTNCIILATSTGIFKSMNGGATWSQKATGNFKQLLYSASDTSVIFASKYYDAGTGASGQIFRSGDNGNTWTQVTGFSKVLRVGLAVTPANPSIVKALTCSSDPSGNLYGIEGVYNSSDTGHTFTQIYTGSCANNILDWNPSSSHSCGGQGEYDLMIAIDPADASHVYISGVNAWYSTNGGSGWSILTQWSPYAATPALTTVPVVHADKHVSVFHPLVPGRFFECNDGGVYTADNIFSGSTTWKDITRGLGITEFYSNAVSNITQGVLGGAQDNGSMLIVNKSMGEMSGGDGMQCQEDPLDSTTLYTSSEYGTLILISGLYGPSPYGSGISYHIPGNPQGDWLTPFMLLPSCNTCILAGYDQVYLSPDQGSSWNSISPIFYSGKNISCLGITPADSQTIYAVTSLSNLIHVTFDLGATWTSLTADVGNISSIEVDPKNKQHFWVTFSGFGTTKVDEFKPIPGLKKLNTGLPNVPVNCIRMDTSTRILYVGTDLGVFYKTDTGSVWMPYNNGLPAVRISQLNINYTTKQIWAATYGRGMWSSPAATNPNDVHSVNKAADIVLSPNPNNGAFSLIADNYYGNKRVDIRLIDNLGRTVWSNALRFDGSGKVAVQTRGLANGIYFLEAACENIVIAKKKVVVE